MVKRLLAYFRNYKVYAILCPVMMLLEVVCDVFMPLMMAKIVNRINAGSALGLGGADVEYILKIGGLMVLLA